MKPKLYRPSIRLTVISCFRITVTVAVSAFCGLMWSQSFAEEVEVQNTVYRFEGIQLWGEYRSRLAPVVGSNGSRLVVETKKGLKRVSFSNRFETQSLISSSSVLIEMLNLEYNIGSSGNHKNIHNGVAEPPRYWVVANVSFLAPMELDNVYCVFIAGKAGVEVRSIGKLRVGLPNQVRIRLITDGPIAEEDCSIYLFSGDGEPLATTESPGLQAQER